MTERERLIDMLAHVGNMRIMRCGLEECADYMIANGVVIVDPEKYPPVTNRGIIDTIMGVPLDEMAELVKAKQEGRLIVPLFTLGQTVYNIEYGINHVLIGEVYEIVSNEYGIIYRASRKGYYGFSFTAHAIGKTVFLTSEDAERALSKRSKT